MEETIEIHKKQPANIEKEFTFQLEEDEYKSQLENEEEEEEVESAIKKQFKSIEIIDSKLMQEYEMIEELGYGSSGKVFKVFKGKYYAFKQMKNVTHQNIRIF